MALLTTFERELGLTLAMGVLQRTVVDGEPRYDLASPRDGVDIDAAHYRCGAFLPDRLVRRPLGRIVNPCDSEAVLARARGIDAPPLRMVEA